MFYCADGSKSDALAQLLRRKSGYKTYFIQQGFPAWTAANLKTKSGGASMGAIVYTKNFCPYCDMAKQLLTEKGVAYQEININHSDKPDAIIKEIQSFTAEDISANSS